MITASHADDLARLMSDYEVTLVNDNMYAFIDVHNIVNVQQLTWLQARVLC